MRGIEGRKKGLLLKSKGLNQSSLRPHSTSNSKINSVVVHLAKKFSTKFATLDFSCT